MRCPNCDGSMVAFPVPASVRPHLPEEPAGAAICRDCLTLEPIADPPADQPDFTTILGEFPTGEAGAIAAAFVSRLGSLALNRREIEALADLGEDAGVDVLLLIDRIATSGRIEPHFDVDRRRPQLQQLLEESD
jgi:hypothetical protein